MGWFYLSLVWWEGLSLLSSIWRFISKWFDWQVYVTWFDWKDYHNLVLLEGLSLPGLIRRFFYTWYGGNVFFFFPLFNGKFWWEVSNLSSHGFMGMFYFHMVWWEGFSPHGLNKRFYLHTVWWEGFISTWFVGKVYLTRFILTRFNSFISLWSDWSVYLYLIWWEVLSPTGFMWSFISTWLDGKVLYLSGLMEWYDLPLVWWEGFISTWFNGNVYLSLV